MGSQGSSDCSARVIEVLIEFCGVFIRLCEDPHFFVAVLS